MVQVIISKKLLTFICVLLILLMVYVSYMNINDKKIKLWNKNYFEDI